jgi:hypothetical protein
MITLNPYVRLTLCLSAMSAMVLTIGGCQGSRRQITEFDRSVSACVASMPTLRSQCYRAYTQAVEKQSLYSGFGDGLQLAKAPARPAAPDTEQGEIGCRMFVAAASWMHGICELLSSKVAKSTKSTPSAVINDLTEIRRRYAGHLTPRADGVLEAAIAALGKRSSLYSSNASERQQALNVLSDLIKSAGDLLTSGLGIQGTAELLLHSEMELTDLYDSVRDRVSLGERSTLMAELSQVRSARIALSDSDPSAAFQSLQTLLTCLRAADSSRARDRKRAVVELDNATRRATTELDEFTSRIQSHGRNNE